MLANMPANPFRTFRNHGLIARLNAGANPRLNPHLNGDLSRQRASCFCLRSTRSTDGRWQFLAMDTGLHA